jgi:hypothetical protein
VHIGVPEGDRIKIIRDLSYWEKQLPHLTAIFCSIDYRLHEHLAQLLTYQSLNTLIKEARRDESREVLNKRLGVFKELSRRQPPEYRVDDYFGANQGQLMTSMALLRNQWLKGVFEAWDMIMKIRTEGES